MANQVPPNQVVDDSVLSLRDIGVGPKVPTRVQNVIAAAPERHELLDLPLAEAHNRWTEVEQYLLTLRSFGRGSCAQLHRVVQQELRHLPNQHTADTAIARSVIPCQICVARGAHTLLHRNPPIDPSLLLEPRAERPHSATDV
jgi:hypothetical protein